MEDMLLLFNIILIVFFIFLTATIQHLQLLSLFKYLQTDPTALALSLVCLVPQVLQIGHLVLIILGKLVFCFKFNGLDLGTDESSDSFLC